VSTPAITLEVLPAGFGDCLLLSCPAGDRTWRMLIDTGPDEAYPALRARLAELPLGPNGKRHIDLFIVSHIDHDHIGGASLLLNDQSLKLSFGDIWFNAPPRSTVRGVAEGESLAQLLGATERALPWNLVFEGKPISTSGPGEHIELAGPGIPRVTVLSPTPERLQALYVVWDKELERLRRKERDRPEQQPAPSRSGTPSLLDLESIASRDTPTDRAVPNGSSIAILVEHQGASVLLAADAFADVLVPALQGLAQKRNVAGPLPLDAVKLSHHGSRANVTSELIESVDADHFIFSTNNAYFNHPNDEAVARTIIHSPRKPTLWFNYHTERNQRWATEELRQRYGFKVQFPDDEATGVKLELPGHRTAR
jgi:beta-lactamase superfamily II metal-dependent hydrolase